MEVGCSVWIWDVHILKVEGADLYNSHFSGTIGDKNPTPRRLEIPNGIITTVLGPEQTRRPMTQEWESRNNPTCADRLTHLIYVTVWHCRQWGKGSHFIITRKKDKQRNETHTVLHPKSWSTVLMPTACLRTSFPYEKNKHRDLCYL